MSEKSGGFLKRLPQAMDKELRIFLDIMSTAAEIVDLSYKEIFDASYKLVLRGNQSNFENPFEFRDVERVLIFRACWSMIDQCNMIRTALSTAKFSATRKITTSLNSPVMRRNLETKWIIWVLTGKIMPELRKSSRY